MQVITAPPSRTYFCISTAGWILTKQVCGGQGSVWLDPHGEERFGPFSDCAKGHVAVRPQKGRAKSRPPM